MKILGFTAKPVILTGGRNVSVKTGATQVNVHHQTVKEYLKTDIRV